MIRKQNIQIYFLVGGIILLLVFLSALFAMSIRQKYLIMNEIYSSAESLFDNIVLTRRWNANYGGVYVLKRPGIESNPYIENPDIHTVDGKTYTMKNHALMTLEISKYAQELGKFSYHITSLKLINPNNAPDDWEKKALQMFEQGNPEITKIETIQGKKMYRLMRPLKYEASCDMCHAKQGYKVGDIRGGISVTLPFQEVSTMLSQNKIMMISLAVGISLVLGFVLYFFVWRLMTQLSIQNVQLEELNELKNKFLGIAAHDLRNPIDIFRGYLTILLKGTVGKMSQPQEDILKNMNRVNDNMLNLINDLLDVNTIESGKLELKKEKVDLNQYLQQIYEENALLAKAKSMSLKLNLELSLIEISLDRNRIGQVVNNLINNAIKYSYPETEIILSAKRKDNEVVISVTDQGQGIPTEERSKLFSDFGKTSVRPTAGEKSTGLGLAIVKRMVEAHKGRIWVESEVGKGSTFYFSLPLE